MCTLSNLPKLSIIENAKLFLFSAYAHLTALANGEVNNIVGKLDAF